MGSGASRVLWMEHQAFQEETLEKTRGKDAVLVAGWAGLIGRGKRLSQSKEARPA